MSAVTEQQSTELIKIEEITSIMSTASEILTKNEKLVNSAVNGGQILVDTAASGMSDDLDTAMNEWQLKAKTALKIMNDRRSPITQLMTKVARVFTSMESKLDPAKTESIFAQVQNLRNAYAKKKAEEKRLAEAEINRKKCIADERVELLAAAEKQIRDTFTTKIYEFKAYYSKKFNEITLDNLFATKKLLEDAKLSYPMEKYMDLPVALSAVYLDKNEVSELIAKTRSSLYHLLDPSFKEAIETHNSELIEKIPSKKVELENIAKASAEEADRLLKQKQDREKAEAEAQKQAQIIEKQQSDQKLQEQKEQQKVNNLFDAHADIATIAESEKPIREAYKIEVKNYAGWMQIASFWFEREGKTLDADKFEKKTLGQMKAFAEKAALKNDKEKITSDHLVYEEVIKAVVKK